MPLGEQARKRLTKQLERQGARIKRTKSGWLVFTEQGTMGLHRSATSDSRHGDRALRKDVERLGLTWPFGN